MMCVYFAVQDQRSCGGGGQKRKRALLDRVVHTLMQNMSLLQCTFKFTLGILDFATALVQIAPRFVFILPTPPEHFKHTELHKYHFAAPRWSLGQRYITIKELSQIVGRVAKNNKKLLSLKTSLTNLSFIVSEMTSFCLFELTRVTFSFCR